MTITPAVKQTEIIFRYHGLPYDCTAIEPLSTSNQAFFVVSSHILFTFVSQVPHVLVLNSFGEQYVKERAFYFPNSVFANARSVTRNGFDLLLDNCTVIPYSSSEYFLLRGNGEITRCDIQTEHHLFNGATLTKVKTIPADCQCGVALSADGAPLLFAGSISATSYLVDLRDAIVVDELHCQSSPNNCRSITDKENHRVDESYLMYSCGYARPSPTPEIGANFVTRLQQNLSLENNAGFPITSTLNHSFLRCVHVNETQSFIVMSDGETTTVYAVNEGELVFVNENAPLVLGAGTIDVSLTSGEPWGLSGAVLVQVCDRGVMVCQNNQVAVRIETVQDIAFNDSRIMWACVEAFTV